MACGHWQICRRWPIGMPSPVSAASPTTWSGSWRTGRGLIRSSARARQRRNRRPSTGSTRCCRRPARARRSRRTTGVVRTCTSPGQLRRWPTGWPRTSPWAWPGWWSRAKLAESAAANLRPAERFSLTSPGTGRGGTATAGPAATACMWPLTAPASVRPTTADHHGKPASRSLAACRRCS